MALDPKEADKLRRLLKEINDLSKILGKNIDLSQFKDLEKSADAIKALFAGLNKEVEKLDDNLDEISKNFGDLIKKIKSAEEGSKKTVKAFDNFGDIARQIYNHQKGSNELSADEADLLVTKIKNQKKRLEDLQKQLKLEQDHFEKKKKDNTLTQDALDEINDKIKENLKSQEKINDLLSDQNDSYDTLLSKAKDIRRQQENMQKALGLSGAAVDGIGNAFKKIGLGSLASQLGIDKAKAKMKEMADRLTDSGKKSAHLVTQFRVLGAGIGSLGRSVAKNLTDPLVLAGLAAKGVATGIKGVQKGVGLLKKGIGAVRGLISRMWSMVDSFAAIFEKHAAAGQFAAQNFSAIGSQVGKITAGMNSQVNLFMRWKEAGPALKALVDGTGMMAQEIVRSTNEAHNFTYWLGYSAEETGKLYALGQLNNESLRDTVAIVRGKGQLLNLQYKTSLDLRKVEQEVAKASATVKYNLSNNPKALAEAAFFATKLGMSLKEIESAAESTLNFEQSIQDQLTYQTMTGKELNIDAYQQAALSGDAATAAKELDKLIQAQGPSLRGNVLQQEAFAKALGISKDQLAQALTIQELSGKIQGDRASIEKALQHEMAKGLTRDQAAAKLAKDGIATSLAQSKKAEAFSRWLESFRDWMTMNLWPLFKAIFSPANIKVFMTVLRAVRPLMTELGKAISAFFSPENADKLVQILKQDVIPTIMTLAKMLTDIAGGAGKTLLSVFNILGGALRESVIPLVGFLANIIKDLAPEVGVLIKALAGGIASVFKKVNDNKEEIKDFIMTLAGKLKDVFNFISGHLKEIGIAMAALQGFSLLKSSGAFELVKMAAGVARLGRGANPMTPLFTRDTTGMGFMDKLKNVLTFGAAGNTAKTASTTTSTASTLASKVSERGSSPMNPLFVQVVGKMAGALPAGMKYDKAGRLQYEKGNELGKKGFVSKADAEKLGVSRTVTTGRTAAPLTPPTGGGNLGSVPAGADKAAGGMSKFANMAVGLLAAAAALVIIAGALYIAAKAFQEFASVKWESVGKGIVVLGGLIAAAYGLSKIKGEIIQGAAAIAIMAGALWVAAKAFQEFNTVNWESVGKGIITLAALAGAAAALSFAGPALIAGGAAVALLGASLWLAAKGIQEFVKIDPSEMEKAGIALAGLVIAVKIVGKSSGDVLKGGAAVALIAASLWLAAKGIQEFANVDIESAGKAAIALAALGGAVVGISKLLSKKKKQIMEAGVAMVLMAGSLYIMAKAIQEFDDVDPESMVKAGLALGALAAAAWGLSKLKKEILMGSLAMVAMGAALWVVAKAAQEFSDVKWEDMGKAGAALVVLTGAVLSLGAVMASGLGAAALMLGVAAMIAMGAALYVVAQGIKALTDAVGHGRLETLGEDLGKGLTSITSGLKDVDFDDLEDTFDSLEDAFDELDIDQLVAFSALAEGKLGDAATNLMNGLKNLTNLQDGKGGDAGADLDFNKFTESLKARLAPLEDVNSIFEDVIEELNLEELSQFSQIAGEGISGAIDGLMKGITTLAEGFSSEGLEGITVDNAWYEFGDSITNRLSDMEDVFDALEDVIGELDFEGLKKFSEWGNSANSSLTVAAEKVIAGVNAMAGMTTPVATISDEVYTAFRRMGSLMRTLDVSAFTEFASLANADMQLAVTKLMAGMDILIQNSGKITNKISQELINTFAKFNEAIGKLKMDQLKGFADLASADFKSAATKIKEGITELDKFSAQLEGEINGGIVHNFEAVKTIFKEIDETFKDVKFDQLLKLSELGKASFENVGSTMINGFNNLRSSFGEIDAEAYKESFDKVKKVFDKLGEIFDPAGPGGKSIDILIKFATTDFSKFKDSIKGFKEGLVEFLGISSLGDFSSVVTKFQQINSIFSTKVAEGEESKSLDVQSLIDFGGADFSKFKSSVKGLKEGLTELQTISTLFASSKTPEGQDVNPLKPIMGFIEELAKIDPTGLEKLKQLADLKLDNFKQIAGQLKSGFETIGTITINDVINQLNSSLPQFIPQINSLMNLESTKILTLADAICKLSGEFVKFNEVLVGFKGDSLQNVLNSLGSLNASLANIKTTVSGGSVSNYQDGTIQMQDGVIQVQDSNLNPNGGLVISKYQKGQLQPVAQGIREDNVYLTPNRPSSGGGGTTVQDNSQVVAAIQALTNAITNSQKEVVVNLNGQTVGKIMTPTIVGEIRKQAVNL